MNNNIRQAGTDLRPACAIVGGTKDPAISPGEEIRAGNRKGINTRIRQAGIDRSPACAVVGGKKDAAAHSPGKEIRAACGETLYCTAVWSIGLDPLGVKWAYMQHQEHTGENNCY